MALMNTGRAWGWPARLIHWLLAVLILGLLAVGFYMVEVLGEARTCDGAIAQAIAVVYGKTENCAPDFLRIDMTQTHKSFGFIVFWLVVLRLLWRAVNRTPALPAHMSRVERALARGGHLALYVGIVVMPLSGWLMATSSELNDPGGYVYVANEVFGLFPMPDLYPKGDRDVSEFWGAVHFYTGLALAALILIHIAAALKHALIDRDGVLRRMVRGA